MLLGIFALQHSWMYNRMTRSRISRLPHQHILLPWQQLTNDLHYVEFEKTTHFVSKIVSKLFQNSVSSRPWASGNCL